MPPCAIADAERLLTIEREGTDGHVCAPRDGRLTSADLRCVVA